MLSLQLRSKHSGFHLIEMLATLTILAILASALIPMIETAHHRQQEEELKADLKQLRSAIDLWKSAYDKGEIPNTPEQSGYPPTLQALIDGVQLSPNQPRRRFLRSIPINPLLPNTLPTAQMWGLRSYVSTHTKPEAGADVYDVYCPCDGIGLNGVAYREW
jgi:general secretion pathway protein G